MKDQYRILIVHNYYQQSGGEDTVIENEKKMLEEKGHYVSLYTRTNSEINTFSERIKFLFSFCFSKRSFREIRNKVREEHIDIVHVHNTFPLITTSVYLAAHDAGVPVVQTLHNFRMVCPNALYLRNGKICEQCNEKGLCTAVKYGCYRNSKLQTLFSVMALSYSRKKKHYDEVDAYITLTDFNKKKFESAFLWCRSRIYIKPNFTVIDETKIDQNVKHLNKYIYAGRLSKEKGIQVLIDAFALMTEVTLEIVGTGPMEEDIKGYIQNNDLHNIELIGKLSREATIKEIAGSKAVIVPSICYEGFGMTIIEAFACGVPVIGSRLGSIADNIDEMENGILFQSGNAEDLARVIAMLDKDDLLREKLSIGAKDKYNQQYTKDANYKRLLEIYDIASKNFLDTKLKLKSNAFL